MSDHNKSFEESLKRLEEIVRQMEQGNVSLDDSLRLFEEGTSLVKCCSDQLNRAELKVIKLMKGPDGNPVETEFNENGI